jgi:hypothetical protein
MSSTDIITDIPTNVDVILLPVWQDVWRKVERSVSGVRQYNNIMNALRLPLTLLYNRGLPRMSSSAELMSSKLIILVDCHVFINITN